MLTTEAAILREIDDMIARMNGSNATVADIVEQISRRLEKIEDRLGIDPRRRPVLKLVYAPETEISNNAGNTALANGNGVHELSRAT